MFAMTLACGFAARAEETEFDPAKVSESLKAIFQFGSAETKKALNANTVTVMSGTIGGTYVQFGADLASVLDDGNKLRVLSIVGRGSVQSVADILFLQGVDLGIVRADTLDYLEKKGFAKDIKKQFSYVTKLYNEEMHVIASKSIRSLKELDGKTVSVDLPNGGTFVTASIVFERLGLKPKLVYIEQRIALEKLRAGEIDAVVAVQGKPSKAVSQIKDDRLHLVPVDYAKPLQGDYLPASLSAKDYPNLISDQGQVDTIAASADAADEIEVHRFGRTCRPTSGSTMTSCAAGMASTVSTASTATLRLIRASAIGPSSWWRAEVPTKPTAFSPSGDVRAADGQAVLRAVEVQQRQPTRRAAERVHARDGLLPAVAALLEVDGRADPAELVGDRAVVGVEAEARLAPRDAQRFEGPQPGSRAGCFGVRLEAIAGHEVVRRSALARRRAPRHRGRRGVESDLDAHHEAHPVQEVDQRLAGARLGVRDERLAVVDAGEGVLDVAVRAEDQRLGPDAGREALEELGGQAVQPGEPVGTGDPDHVAVREVDEALTGLEDALLAVERAVVRGDRGVDPVAADGAGQVEQGAGHEDSSSVSVSQSTQWPKIARWPRSTVEAVIELAGSATSAVATSGSTERTR